MQPQHLQAFLARLGELTAEQMRVLGATMAGSRTDAVVIIEARFAAGAACPHCNATQLKRYGHTGGLQRYKCLGRLRPHVYSADRNAARRPAQARDVARLFQGDDRPRQRAQGGRDPCHR